jgi:hypothetical protein
MTSNRIWNSVDLVRTDVSEERVSSIFRVETFRELGTASAVTCRPVCRIQQYSNLHLETYLSLAMVSRLLVSTSLAVSRAHWSGCCILRVLAYEWLSLYVNTHSVRLVHRLSSHVPLYTDTLLVLECHHVQHSLDFVEGLDFLSRQRSYLFAGLTVPEVTNSFDKKCNLRSICHPFYMMEQIPMENFKVFLVLN